MKMQRNISGHHLLITLIAFFFLLHACPSSSEPAAYSDCAPAPYVCGEAAFTIGYPFRIDGRHDSCGYPNFYLSCSSNDTLTITISNKNFQVTSIDYDNRLLYLVDAAFVRPQSCPQPHNTTVDPTLFRVSDRNTNLTLFINCTASAYPSTYYDLMCVSFGWTGQHSYYRLDNGTTSTNGDDASGMGCSSTVVVPMAQDAAARLANRELDFGAALQQGFSVSWLPGMDWCGSKCGGSGGRCGYNASSPGDHTCFCSNGTFVDSCPSSDTRTTGKRHYHRWRTILGICAAAGVASFIIGSLFITLWCPSHKREAMGAESEREVMDAESVQAIIKKHGSLVLRSYTYSDVKKITKSFSEKLGQGGYGTVFKGKLFDGHLVAVKVLSESKGNGEDFVNEVATIGQTSHVNVVTLRGFCVQGSKRALIYDFMPNGSLEKYISSESTATETPLRWEKLYEIVIGIARGLEYLHRGCNTRIVHFDIKPHNILLDQDLCPKISDFGMAKLCPGKGSIISMEGARGTIGYIAPEVFSRTFGTVSSKSDVYSYGMVLLETFGGKRKRSSRLDSASDAYFPNWIYEHIDENDNLTAYGVTSETEEIARKMMIVGFWCIQTMPENRPSMSRVVDMLEGRIKDLSIPPKPCLTSPVDLIVGSCATSST
ncbi:LEAF RUST 10 DISEASE-RESISTANCE LOCUS RECEPTOR-LIKE PROTEIN KINASE-like 2.5 [Iris pallida]|uniref:LEAF RUST 10 DISEASE-RESISTANCE LOCUS RECEPTOR-LIKE PROTEIN KINASE-like 2.5 n=1 Tax=Iris pallida TaxID=29817 RepID=A0AAX6HG69_IRIPA|nr:LEAF RUST 10 DISEASE-RESISTANCE LOCUS RECEPTOR-LIKE PROTEIN KINASE-like 2.5 [Iris pallida]